MDPLWRLGLDPLARERLEGALSHPHGLIALAGRGSCGLTTTALAIAGHLARRGHSVVAIDWKVEHLVPLVMHVECTPSELGAYARRACERADADVVVAPFCSDFESTRAMLEIGDRGRLAIGISRASSPAEALYRMVGYGAAPDLVCSAVTVVHTQRLLRRLCPCRRPRPADDATLHAFRIGADVMLRLRLEIDTDLLNFCEPAGCAACDFTGYVPERAGFDALAVASETLVMSDPIRRALTRQRDERVFAAARAEGMWTLRDSALRLALTGVTSLAEVVRMTPAT